ncbi:hypothetical protein N7486_007959 [Penicillium sp. IBT 16267x]|nr:hypothetical protein N7486_007959 [Penicillium sp. IBT 16267x]
MASIKFGDGNSNSGTQVAINNGVINLRTEQPESRPNPLSTIPFPPDPDFVSRDQILDQIHKKASIPGKTQIAIEYAHQVRRHSPETWVFWVHASNAARCEKSLRDLADRVKIPGRQDHNVDIFQLVGNWLQDETIGKWILVLDNVDDDRLLRKPSSTGPEGQNCQTTSQSNDNISTQPPLRPLLQNSNGFIIITSRSQRVGSEIAGHKNLIDVLPMKKPEAVDLLQKKLNISAERESMEQLVDALELMPLAIIQAAGYITHRPRCSVSQYLEKIQQSDRAAMRLLDYEAGLLSRDWDAKNSILLTWQISFDYIKDVRPSAAGLLSLMSFFDRQGIQESVLRVQQTQKFNDNSDSEMARDSSSQEDEDDDASSEENESFEDDITMLNDYSLISFGEPNTVLTMHRLIQLTEMASKSRKQRLAIFGEEDEKTLKSTILFGRAHRLEGQLEKAEELQIQMIEMRKMKLGGDHRDTLKSISNLALTYADQGRWEEAEKLQVQVMETRKTKLGADHRDTLTSISNLAATYTDQGRWEEAEKLQVQVMETYKAKLGMDHPDTLLTMNNLASTYAEKGRWEEAEKLQLQVLEISKTKLGVDHPDTLLTMNNLASTYAEQGRREEAEKLYLQVLETRKTKLGVDHPDTLLTMNDPALTYADQGRWEEAEELQVQVMETRKTKLGVDHPRTLTSMVNLAFIWESTSRHSEAIGLLRTCVAKQQRILGSAHPETVDSSNMLLEWEMGGGY